MGLLKANDLQVLLEQLSDAQSQEESNKAIHSCTHILKLI